MGIAEEHKGLKANEYWQDLDAGNTTRYKEVVIERLIGEFFPPNCESIIDIGCGGNCEHILKYREKLQARKIACFDYDPKIIGSMQIKYPCENISWHIDDVFALEHWKEQYDLVFFLDMLHEVYSFFGRPERDMNKPINHKLGQDYVRNAVTNVVKNMKPLGIIITDSALCEVNDLMTIRLKSEKVTKAIEYFLKNYSTFEINAKLAGDVLEIKAQEFATLSTQYNKIKREDWVRWNVEKLERHQYMTLSEYKQMFENLGYMVHAVVETPPANLREWQEDFEILNGTDFPEKRITLLAVRQM